MDSRMENAALWYASTFKWKVILVGPKTKRPLIKSTTEGEGGVHEASDDPEQLREWFEKHPRANVGINLGASGLFVLDVDPRNGGEESFEKLTAALGIEDFTGPQVLTGGGGRHYYFRRPKNGFKKSDVGVLFRKDHPGLDVLCDGCYVVAPPSTHASGKDYEWELSSEPQKTPLPDVPEAMLTLVRGRAEGEPKPPVEFPEDIVPKGGRNQTLFDLACVIRRSGLTPEDIAPALHAYNARHCVPPLKDSEVEGIARKAGRYEPGAPVRPKLTVVEGDRPPDAEASTATDQDVFPHYPETDLGNVERLVARYGSDFRFCPALGGKGGKFLVWSEGRWKLDEEGVIYRYTAAAVRAIVTEEVPRLHPGSKAQERLLKHATASEGRSRLEAMVWGARHQKGVVVSHEDLDQKRRLLAVKNGTVDLDTGELRPPDRADLITRYAPVTYTPEAEAPRFRAFLMTTFQGDLDLIAFVQRALGYSITGSTTERAFFIAHGGGKNGKSTLLNTVGAILGDYSATTPTQTLMEKRFDDGPSNDLARLRGARFVTAFESSEGKRLSEGTVKQLTGGDRLTARFLHSEFFEFDPQFTIWLSTNHRPTIHGTDDAIWDRVKMVPFLNRLSPEEQDQRLGRELQREREGILAWLVAGAMDWAKNGLGTNPKVEASTESYREDQDQLGRFIEERCIVQENQIVKSSDLNMAYREWCERNGERAVGQGKLGERLAMKGYKPDKAAKGVRVWVGLRLDGTAPTAQDDLPI